MRLAYYDPIALEVERPAAWSTCKRWVKFIATIVAIVGVGWVIVMGVFL